MISFIMNVHIPILYNEIETLILKLKPHTIIDCTYGAGGHTNLFLKHGCKVVGIDYDEIVSQNIAQNIDTQHKNFIFIHDSFKNLSKYNISVDFIFADLGLSSMQIDEQDGFSFSRNTSLDMCSDATSTPLKHKIPNLNYNDIYTILNSYTNLTNANIIARNIYNAKILGSINTTYELIAATKLNNQNHFHKPMLAQIFQAFRIYNNDEIQNLEILLDYIIEHQINFGIIAFHSIESKLIKQKVEHFYRINTFIKPSSTEIDHNTRARCAILRIGYNI